MPVRYWCCTRSSTGDIKPWLRLVNRPGKSFRRVPNTMWYKALHVKGNSKVSLETTCKSVPMCFSSNNHLLQPFGRLWYITQICIDSYGWCCPFNVCKPVKMGRIITKSIKRYLVSSGMTEMSDKLTSLLTWGGNGFMNTNVPSLSKNTVLVWPAYCWCLSDEKLAPPVERKTRAHARDVRSLMTPECSVWARSRFLWIRVVQWYKGQGSDEGTEPKLDRRWEGSMIVQETDEYKTKGKVQLLCDTYTWYRIAYSK